MCGLILVTRLDEQSAVPALIKRYNQQKARGTSGFGYIPIEDGYIKRVERFTEEADFLEAISKETASEILLHHRAPTSTENLIGTTHPVVVDDAIFKYKYYLIHNGTLRNEVYLKSQHEKLGLRYNTSFTVSSLYKFDNTKYEEEVYTKETGFLDSEALAKEVALYIEGHKDKIEIRGGVAFMCYQTEQDGKVVALHYAKNDDRPLIEETVISKKKKKKKQIGNYMCLKSEGNGVHLPSDVLYSYYYGSDRLTEVEVPIGEVAYKVQMGYGQTPKEHTPKNLLPEPKASVVRYEWDESTNNYKQVGADLEKGLFTYEIDTPLTDKMITSSKTSHLESRLEALEEEIATLEGHRVDWVKILQDYGGSKDAFVAQNEIESIFEREKGCRAEKKNIEDELCLRYSTKDYMESVESPYQEHIIQA